MLFAFLSALVFGLVAWGIMSAHDKWWAEDYWDEWYDGVIFWAVVVGICLGVAAPLFGWISVPTTPHFWHQKVVSVQDGQQTQGSFYLGSGVIGTEAYYTYYYQAGPDSYVQDKVPVEGTTIVEDAETPADARIDAQRTNTSDWGLWIAFTHTGVWYHTATIHVPKGTIIRNFNLNGG